MYKEEVSVSKLNEQENTDMEDVWAMVGCRNLKKVTHFDGLISSERVCKSNFITVGKRP